MIGIRAFRHRRRSIVNRAWCLDRKASIPTAHRKTCRIGRRPPRNIVPTRAELSLLKLCRVQPILCNTAQTAQMLSILSTSERKNFLSEKLFQPIMSELCNSTKSRNLWLQCIQVRLRSAKLMRALFCPHWHEQSIHSTSAARNFPTAMLSLSMFRGWFNWITPI